MRKAFDQMNRQIHRMGGLKMLGAILTAALSKLQRSGVGADQILLAVGVRHGAASHTLIGTWRFVSRDQYTTIVRSKPYQMVLNHPKKE